MDVTVSIVAVDIPKQVIILGNIEETEQGIKITNKCQYKIMPKVIPHALQALGQKARVGINYGMIMNIEPVGKNEGFRSQPRSCSLTGMIVESIDGIKREILFRWDAKSKIYCKAYLHPKTNNRALRLLGKKCTFYLITKTPRIKDRCRTIVAVTERTL